MAYKQKNNPFTYASSSSLNTSSSFKVATELTEPEAGESRGLGEIIAERKREKMIAANLAAVENLEAEDRLQVAAGEMMNRFTNPEDPDSKWMPEGGADQKDYIENELFADVDYTEVWDKDKGEYRPVDSTRDAWSAAAVSKLATAFDPEFEGSAQHAQYINRAFQGEGNYEPTRIKNKTDFKPGDILFKGRDSGPQNYKQFKNAAKKGWDGNDVGDGYKSHSDIITGVSVGEDGVTRYTIQGGNIGDTLTTETYTAKQLADKYAGRLTK